MKPGITGLWAVLMLMPLVAAGVGDETDIAIVRIHTEDRAVIQALSREHQHLMIPRGKGVVIVDTTPEQRAAMHAQKLDFEVDADATRAFNAPLLAAKAGIPGFGCYRTVAETNARMTQLASLYPNLASVVDIGDSWEKAHLAAGNGEDLRVLKLTNSAVPGPKPVFFASFSIHPRELPTAELGLRFGEWLLTNYNVDPDATWILDHHEVHLLAITNPDGRKKAEGGSSWRKNTNQAYCGVTSNSRGVDLNRNMLFQWNCCGTSSPNVCVETYHGPSPLSDPESHALDDYLKVVFADRRGPNLTDAAPADTSGVYMDIHNYANLVIWPWGYEDPPATGPNPAAPNGAAMQTFGRRLAWFNHYLPEQSNELYGADGATDDNAYGQLGVAAFTIELGDTQFSAACSNFESTIYPDNLKALIYAARVTRAPYLLPGGPDALGVTTSPPRAFAGDAVRLNATIDDTHYNQSNGTEPTQTIASAKAYIETPPWIAGATAIALAANDGAFNLSTEPVQTTLVTSGLGLGKHLIYVQGRDAGGADGPVGAAFVEIVDPATNGSIVGSVHAVNGGAAIAAAVAANSASTTADAANGAYVHRLLPATYTLTASAPHYEPVTQAGIALAAGQTLNRDIAMYSLCTRLNETAESGAGSWTTQVTAGSNTWGIANAAGAMSTRFWTESPGGNYANNANTSLISPALDLSGYDYAVLSFDSVCDTEAGYDYGLVEVRANAAAVWTEVFKCSGDTSLQRVTRNVPQLNNAPQAQIRFRFTSDGGAVSNGWAVDNIAIEAGSATCRAGQQPADPLFADGFE